MRSGAHGTIVGSSMPVPLTSRSTVSSSVIAASVRSRPSSPNPRAAWTNRRPAVIRSEASRRAACAAVRDAMSRVAAWNQLLTARALDGLGSIPGITIYGPRDPAQRTSLVAFNLAGHDPVSVARALDQAGIESRAGCHCATLAHHALGLTPPASCRLSFYLYNTPAEIDRAVAAVAEIAAGHPIPRSRSWTPRRALVPAGRPGPC